METSLKTIELLKALLTPTLAILGGYIAILQFKLSREKHLSEIYDRRMRIYKSTVGLLQYVNRHYSISEDRYYEWEASVAEAEFLFGKEVVGLLEDMSGIAFDIVFVQKNDDYQEIKTELTKSNLKHAEGVENFLDFHRHVNEVFSPYFNLYKYKKPLIRHKYNKIHETNEKRCEIRLDGDEEIHF